ncbi:MAG: hypothetical protein N3E39_04045 [Candidatus Methanomethylicia archaeon]|nr:hypothetical protein [Candidatus Methanomethylicia archaeon]
MEGKTEFRSKIERAAQLLLIQRHRKPGVKGWELKRALGRRYLEIIRLLDEELSKFGLKVKIVFMEDISKPRIEDYDKAVFMVTFRYPAKITDVLTAGWSIDEIGALTACIALINSKDGSIKRRELEDVLSNKLPRWRVKLIIDKFIKLGYLEVKEDYLALGWRSKAEIDADLLSLNLIYYSSTT